MIGLLGYQESLEFYLNLTRKELQGLCKKHNLPANRSHVQLAKSLVSYFKKKNTSSKTSRERSSNLKEMNSSPVKVTKGVNESTSNCFDSDDRQHFPIENEMGQTGGMDIQNSPKVCNSYTHAHAICSCPSNSGGAGFGRSASFSHDVSLRPLAGPKIQDIMAILRPGSECYYSGNGKESLRFMNLRNSPHILLDPAATNYKSDGLAPFPSNQKRFSECPTKMSGRGFVSSAEVITKATPSFEFFVMSDEGVNLYVDLNSSTSDWINSLKNEICINEKVEQCNSGTLCNHIRDLIDADETTEASSGNVMMDCQSTGAGRKSRCAITSLTSVSENCDPESCETDTTAPTSRSSAVTMSTKPFGNSERLEGSQVVLSSSIPRSDVSNHVAPNVSSCTREIGVVPRYAMEVASRLEKRNTETFDDSIKSTESLDTLTLDGRATPTLAANQNLQNSSVGFSDAEVAFLDIQMVNDGKKQTPTKSNGVQDTAGASCSDKLKDHGESCELSAGRDLAEGLSEGLHLKRNSLESEFCRLNQQFVLDCPPADEQSDVGSSDHVLNRHECCSFGPYAAVDHEMGRSILEKGKISECSRFCRGSGKNLKRLQSREFPQDLWSKRLHTSNGINRGTITILRSTKPTSVLPRRSSRLVSKV